MQFELIGEITNVETFAVGKALRELDRLPRPSGRARWRKRKGIATVRRAADPSHQAEVHWDEATGIGRKAGKLKDLLD
jgi:hypothetical protein